MRSSLILVPLLASLSLATEYVKRTTCINDICLQTFQEYGLVASAYCILYKEISNFDLPSWASPWANEPESISSACSCISATSTSSTKSSSSTAKSSSTSSSSSKCVVASTTIISVSTLTAPTSTIYTTVLSTVIPPPSTVTEYSYLVSTFIDTIFDTNTIVTTFDSTITDFLTTTEPPSTATSYITVLSTITNYVTLVSTDIEVETTVSTEIDIESATITETEPGSTAVATVSVYYTETTVETTVSTEIDVLTTTDYSTLISTYTLVESAISASTTGSSNSSSTTSPSSSSSASSATGATSSSSSVSATSTLTSASSSSSTSVSSSSSTSVSSSSSTSSGSICTATVYSQIAPAVAACTKITLDGISVPTNSTINLESLKAGSVVTFAGLTTFAYTNSSTFNPIEVGGAGITIQGAEGHVIDGNGQAYWDGQGSNGGTNKPDHFFVMNKVTANSVIQNLYIQNYPTHCFSISSCSNVVMTNIVLNNSAGDAPNAISSGLPAAHNSDGFDISTSSNFLVTDSTILNQDDCVAITSGNNITVSNLYCSGGHGMSIGSVGGKSNNNVTNILFTNSQIINSQNGARIKSNYNTTGFISNITYSNIAVSNISIYGIDVQQDYLNGGPTGIPSNGVIIQDLTFSNLTGTAADGAQDYYILCGNGSCSDFVFTNVDIVGGTVASSCNYPSTGCPGP